MADKSPRQGMSKKSVKSIKEKRSEKRGKAAGDSSVTIDTTVGKAGRKH